MQLSENRTYHVKLIRLYYPEPKFIWEGRVQFHIQTRANGDIGVLAIKDSTHGLEWAEYCQEDQEEEGNWICEDYQMIVSP